MKRTGKDVELTVRKAAGEEKLAWLRERLRAPATPATVQDPGAVAENWPAAIVPLVSYEPALTGEGPAVRLRYEAEEPLEPVGEEMMAGALRSAAGYRALRVELEGRPPAPQPKGRRK